MARQLRLDVAQFELADHLDRGIWFLRNNRFAEALVEFDVVLSIDPKDRFARWNRVLARLSLGDYVNGLPEHDCAWEIYDWRRLGPAAEIDRVTHLPVWRGERCRLFSYHEMGFGDAIMTLRFLPELVARCESVTLAVARELKPLFEGYGATIVDHVPRDVSGYDARVSLFNSIFTLGHSCETIPSEPYVKVAFDRRPRTMGIAWSGNTQVAFTLSAFLERLNSTGYELYALQATPRDPARVHPLQCQDFKATAELMATLDVIVSVDTAAAHLAGAVGHPNAHLILPHWRDWRWWRKAVWYPTLKVYPQDDPAEWSGVFEQLNSALAQGR